MSDTALHGKIRMPKEKSAYLAGFFFNGYLIRFSKLHLSTQRYHKKIVKTNKN